MQLQRHRFQKEHSWRKIAFSSILWILLVFGITQNSSALSAQAQSNLLRNDLLRQIRFLYVVVANFGNIQLSDEDKEIVFGTHYPEYKNNFNHEKEYNAFIEDKNERAAFSFDKTFTEAKVLYDKATVHYYSNEFLQAEKMYTEVKWKLIRIYKGMTYLYIKQATDILNKAASLGIQKITQFSRQNAETRQFFFNYDPQSDILLYNPKDYYYLFAKTNIHEYLKGGYKYVHLTKQAFGYRTKIIIRDEKGKEIPERQSEFDKVEYKENLTNYEYNLQKNWMQTIGYARQAKMYALETFRILNKYRYNSSSLKYSIRYEKIEKFLDDRIPDEFQFDYLDSLGLVHQDEIKRFEKHLIAAGVDPRRYIQTKDNRLVKVSGEVDKYPEYIKTDKPIPARDTKPTVVQPSTPKTP